MSKFLASLSASILSALVLATPARAASSDYRFEVTGPFEASGDASRRGSTVTVTLIHTPSGQRVTNAEVFRREIVYREKIGPRIDERRVPLTPDGQGNYRLTTYYPLSGGSTLKLGARVPGEIGAVQSTVRVGVQN